MNIPMIPKNLQVSETEQSCNVSQSKSSSKQIAKDTVSIDNDSRILSRLISRLKEIQNTELTDIESIKTEIESDLYKPTPADIAHAILYGPPKNK